MKLATNARYLSLIREAFAQSVIPELQSPSAKAAAELISTALGELARRETGFPECLSAANDAGRRILEEMQTALHGKPAVTFPATAVDSSFDSKISVFSTLCSEISELASRLQSRQECADLLRRGAEWEANAHAAFVKLPVPPVRAATVHDPMPQSALTAYLQTVHPAGDRIRVARLDRMPGGFGKQTYLADIDDGTGALQSLVIRKNDRNPLSSYRSFLMEREFHLLKAVHDFGFLAPKPLWYARGVPDIDAEFIVMERMRGSMIGSFLAGAGARLPESQVLDMAELLAQLHAVPLERFSDLIHRFDDPALLTDTVEQYTRRSVADWRQYADSTGYLPSPLTDYTLNWLANNVPQDQRRPVLIHGDFSIHNLLGEDGRVSAVLDWEGALFGAPELDLAYVQMGIAQHIEWPRFVEHYVACGGRRPALETLNYYMVFNTMRILITLNRGVANLDQGVSNDIRLIMFELGIIPKLMELVTHLMKESSHNAFSSGLTNGKIDD